MRIAIVGSSGSGKTTLARRVSEHVAIPHVEIDSLYHLADWTPNPNLTVDLAAALDQPDWIVDGNYSSAAHLTQTRADVIAVYDLPRRQVIRQVTTRTIRRAITREELWNGNREPLTNFYRWDPEHNVIRWSWTRHYVNRDWFFAAEASGAWAHAEVTWLRSHADADRWVETLSVAD